MAKAKDTREELEKLANGSSDSLEGEMPPGTEDALKIALVLFLTDSEQSGPEDKEAELVGDLDV